MAGAEPLRLVLVYTAAYQALLDTAYAVADDVGEDAAIEWATRVLNADPNLFCRVELDRRPRLRLIEGGR